MISADFVHVPFGPDADLDIDDDDDGSPFITTSHATPEGFFAFDHESGSRLTLVPYPVTFFVARSCCRLRVCWPAGPGSISAPSRQ
jgi:hypothetical protein